MNDKIKLIQGDCMEVMKNYPDNYFDLAIVDPPYGISINSQSQGKGGGVAKKIEYKNKDWDKNAPNPSYFDLLKRKSKNQIIFGANHFIDNFPFMVNSPCWLVWDKENGTTDFADCELAWTSFSTAVRKVRYKWSGMLQADMKNKEKRIHPTQKPVGLYGWILKAYATKGMKILDTHLGSGSNAIAAHYFGVAEFVGIELDKDYYKAACKRVEEQTRQLKLF